MYERIVVATDTTRPSTPVTIASALAADIGALELVTVNPPGLPPGVGRLELERLAIQHGWLPAACTVLTGHDIAATILAHVARRRDALLVIGSHGHRPLTGTGITGPISRRLLADSPDPVLVVGPHVDNRFHASPGKLIVAVDGPDPASATLDAVEQWVHTFDAGHTWIIEVTDPTDERDDKDLTRWVDALRGRGLEAQPNMVHDHGTARSVNRFSTGVRNAVDVATSRRYSDGHRHLHSTTRELIHHGRCPVLVVPDRREPSSRSRARSSPEFGTRTRS
jgi:nucleotide-binding universal stress UspA family protein